MRCTWATISELDQKYHDEEWGVPCFDDQKLFEILTLEVMQAGLSWSTILKKREGFREAFNQFEIHKVSQFTKNNIEHLLQNPKIIRHRQKIESTIQNAKIILQLQTQYGSFHEFYGASLTTLQSSITGKEWQKFHLLLHLPNNYVKNSKN